MTFSLAQQTLVFLEAILLGVIGGFIYDICRAIRQVLNFKTKGTVIIDTFFGLLYLLFYSILQLQMLFLKCDFI